MGLTGYRGHTRDGKGVQTLHLFLRGFFPLVREASARLSSNSFSRLAFASYSAALAFFLSSYNSNISAYPYKLMVPRKLQPTSTRCTHLGHGSMFR